MTETIFGQVISKANNYEIGTGDGERHIIKSRRLREYEQLFMRQCSIYRGRMIDKPFALHIVVYESMKRYDLDNALKTVLDCLQMAGAIKDDNLCETIKAYKRVDSRNPRIMFRIEVLEPDLFGEPQHKSIGHEKP